jgi:hypothetical protein
VHVAQLRSYLKMTGHTLGLIINFNVAHPLRTRYPSVNSIPTRPILRNFS